MSEDLEEVQTEVAQGQSAAIEIAPGVFEQYGDQTYVWGVPDREVKLINVPEDALRVKLRIRADGFAQAFVKFPDRFEHWYIGENQVGEYFLYAIQAVNRND